MIPLTWRERLEILLSGDRYAGLKRHSYLVTCGHSRHTTVTLSARCDAEASRLVETSESGRFWGTKSAVKL